MGRLLKVPEAAERLGFTEAGIRRLIFERRIPFVKVAGRAVRIREEDLEAMIEAGFRPARKSDGGGQS